MGPRHLLLVCLLLAPPSAGSEVLYARPDGDVASGPYFWVDEAVTNVITLREAVAEARSASGTRPLEIRLLRRPGTGETTYSLDLGSTGAALRWRGSAANKLTLRGQVDRSGSSPRALTTIVGERSLQKVLCEPHGADLCAAAAPVGPPDKRQDLLDYLSGELDETGATATSPDIPLRTNCLMFWQSSFVDVADLGFRDCWLAAVATYASSNVTLSGSVIEGSTYAFAAIGRKAWPEASHTYEIIGNTWRQSPAAYRSGEGACDIQKDWSCPVSIWSDIPWGVVHHHFWSPLNGALFTGKDILGNVRIAGNHVIDAYNGVRVRLSDECLANPNCRDRANSGFEIVGNTFEKIRDNAVEPEGRAEYWIIKHNVFLNVYAAISTDGVAGRDFLVFGNVFALDDIPGSNCRDQGWAGSRQFRLVLGGGGRWSTAPAEGDDALCSTHLLGTVIKMGANDEAPDWPVLDGIHFFNNSLRTRSPLYRGAPGPPITSYNNAVEFTACARTDVPSCRQVPTNDRSCVGEQFRTADDLAVFAACFAVRGRDGRAVPHVMRFNAYNRPPAGLDGIDRDRLAASPAFLGDVRDKSPRAVSAALFSIHGGHPLATAGCALRYSGGHLACEAGPSVVGAMMPDGTWFDLDLPFRFPFLDVFRGAAPAHK
jgi:hypothetical protein